MIQEEMFANAVAINFFTDLSEELANGGDIVNISDFYTNTFTVQSQTTAGTEVTLGNPALQNVTLTVDTDEYIAFFRSNTQMAQLIQRERLQEAFVRKASRSLIDSVESSMFALWSGLSANTAIGDTATVLTDLEIRQALRTLDANNHDLGMVGLFIHPQVNTMPALLERAVEKLRKFRGTLTEAILSEAQKWERATTIIGAPKLRIA